MKIDCFKIRRFVRRNYPVLFVALFVAIALVTGQTELAGMASFAAMPLVGERKLLPFRPNTRQNFQKAGIIPYATNSQGSLKLPEVGFLSAIWINYRGTVTLSGAGALTDLAPWNMIARLAVNFNLATAKLVDLTGFEAFLVSAKNALGGRPDLAGMGQSTPHADVFAAPVASGANTWTNWIRLPISANDGTNFESGLINLQAPEITVTVDMLFGAVTDVAALATANSGNFHVFVEYYEVPDPQVVAQPIPMLHRWITDRTAVTGTGDVSYKIPAGGILLQMIHYLQLNNLRSDSWDSHKMVFNVTSYPYQQERQLLRARNRQWNGFDWPTGVFDIDLFHANDVVSAGDGRDTIDTEQVASFQSTLVISSGASLGASNNWFNAVRRITQNFTR